MKRAIKFRAWDNMTKSMYQVRDIDFLANGEINSIRLVVAIQTSEDDIDFDFPIRRSGEYELMQFTGLKDKHRKEIYEGDIIKLDDPNWGYGGMYDKEHDGYFYREVALEHGCFCFKNGSKLYNVNRQSEIIGNIYENPELL